MSKIDLPDLKAKLWHTLRSDLVSIVPWFADNELLLCPACCRALKFEEFSIEHIIPKQSLEEDPPEVQTAVPKNVRSSTTLLCSKPLVIGDRRIPGSGCNSWKGKHYDYSLRRILNSDLSLQGINSRGHVALIIACYLALFGKYGYQISLLPAGLLLRRQFFNPNSLLRELPLGSQMILAGAPITNYEESMRAYWSEPFKITVSGTEALMTVRNIAIRLPLSRSPTTPVARALQYAPKRFKLRPDVTTSFD